MFRHFLMAAALAGGGMAAAAQEAAAPAAPADAAGGFVVICPIEDEIDDGVAVVVERAVREAAGAAGMVFVIDTPGGRVDSAIDITESIRNAPCPTVAYIKGMGAISAGALISYACDTIMMDPASNIGASTPILMGAETTPAIDEKSNSFVRAKYRALGELKGHNPLLGEAMVDAQIELRGYAQADGRYVIFKVIDEQAVEATESGSKTPGTPPAVPPGPMPMPVPELDRLVRELLGAPPAPAGAPAAEPAPPTVAELTPGLEVISPRGSLLTMTPQEAVKYGLAKGKAATLDEALAFVSWADRERRTIVPHWEEALFAFLTSPLIAGILLMCGVGGLYLEMKTPGFGLAGLVGVTCLAVFFGSHLVIGLADWIDVLFFVVGVALILVEIFVLPGFGFVGGTGILCTLVGVYLSLTRVTIPQYSWDFSRIEDMGQTVTVSAVLLFALGVLTWKYFPKSPMWRAIANESVQALEQGYIVQTAGEARAAAGLEGTAVSMLRPAGRGRFNGQNYDVVTRGEFVAPGTPIVIVEVDGNRYVVAARH